MAATIIYLVISLLVSLVFIILGISQYKAEKPVSLNTGEKPPREEELTSVTEWNHRHGRNLIIFGCVLFITLSVFMYFIEKMDRIVVYVVIFMIVLFAEIAWLVYEHSVMKKKMIKNLYHNLYDLDCFYTDTDEDEMSEYRQWKEIIDRGN